MVEDRIEITRDLKPPALLQTCSQIRHEALEIWYTLNNFFITIRDCDDSLMKAFTKLQIELGVREMFPMRLVGRLDWGNLMKWCKNCWDGDSYMLFKKDSIKDSSIIMFAAHDIVLQNVHLPWSTCEHALDNLGDVIRVLHPDWM